MSDNRIEKIKGFYKTWLKREADEPGLNNYSNSDAPLEHIEASIKNSPEALLLAKKEKSAGFECDKVTSGVAVGSFFAEALVGAVKKEGITHVLTTYKTDTDLSEHFVSFLSLGLPDNAVLSVKDLTKSLSFIGEFMSWNESNKGTLLIAGRNGVSVAPGILVMWLVATGLDENSAVQYVASKRDGFDFTSALFGPWHIDAAKTFLLEEVSK